VDKSKPKTKKTHRHPPPPPPKENGPLNSIGNNKMVVMDKNNNKKRSQLDGQLLVRLGTILDGDEEAAEKEETNSNSKDENDQKVNYSGLF
jgi:hypothetical protein